MDKYNIMRMFCMFDLPVETEEQRRNYRIFRKELIQERTYSGRVCYDSVFYICQSLPQQGICQQNRK